ncbi:MAG: T9SS type A sorting domain-containing protein [Bacteroidales bacterium]|nr:T9SS type A sorting domain-containing protein [Bacteroidales bacterium]
MKKYLFKKSFWQSMLSVVVIGIFTLLAAGSVLMLDYFAGVNENEKITIDRGDGVIVEEYWEGDYDCYSTEGKRDDYNRWHGPIVISVNTEQRWGDFTEKVNMVNGIKHGKSVTTYYRTEEEKITCYNMGVVVDCEKKAAYISAENPSAFQVLNNKHPWLLVMLNALGYEDAYVEAYMDTLVTVLGTYEFESIDFDSCYDDAISVLEETPYDSIIGANSLLSFMNGLELIKNSELRMAVIDHYRSDGNSTYNIVKTTYPGYLISLSYGDVDDQDFEEFSQDLDSCMASYGILDLEDPFFVDSVDVRMFRAILSIMDTEESTSADMLKSAARVYVNNDIQSIWHEVNSILKPSLLNSTPAEVSEVALYFILMQFIQGDIIKKSVREAYLVNKGVISVPTVTTVFAGGNSATSVTLGGYVIEDGGADVTSRGITWATYHNPTTDDNAEGSGTGTGEFTVTLTGLTEGDTYYARTYASNSAGTAYGNCISFTAQSTIGINENEIIGQDLSVYPNPASASTTFSFQVESSESMALTIVDLKGQVVYHHDLGTLPHGKHQIELDLSGIPGGIYNCQLTNNGTIKGTRKLVIAR